MKYARYISETAIDRAVPRRAVIDGREVVGELPADYLASLGFAPFDESEQPAEPPDAGRHWEPRYALSGGRVVEKWAQADDPPRTFRRSYLAQWIRAHGKWDALQALLGQSADLAFLWEYSTEFDEDHAQWPAALSAVKAALGLTDADVADMLAAAEG